MTLRRKLLRRKASLRPKVVNPRKTRSRDEFARVYGSKERVAWVKSLPCAACQRSNCQNAHTENGGMGRKADYDTIVPLCPDCHAALHRMGTETFSRLWSLDLSAYAAQVERAWRSRSTWSDRPHYTEEGE